MRKIKKSDPENYHHNSMYKGSFQFDSFSSDTKVIKSTQQYKRASSIEKELSKRYESRKKRLIKTDQKTLNYDYSSKNSSRNSSRIVPTPRETPNFDFVKVPKLKIDFQKNQKSEFASPPVSIRQKVGRDKRNQRVAAPFRSQGLRKRLEKYSDLSNFDEKYKVKNPKENNFFFPKNKTNNISSINKPSFIQSLIKQQMVKRREEKKTIKPVIPIQSPTLSSGDRISSKIILLNTPNQRRRGVNSSQSSFQKNSKNLKKSNSFLKIKIFDKKRQKKSFTPTCTNKNSEVKQGGQKKVGFMTGKQFVGNEELFKSEKAKQYFDNFFSKNANFKKGPKNILNTKEPSLKLKNHRKSSSVSRRSLFSQKLNFQKGVSISKKLDFGSPTSSVSKINIKRRQNSFHFKDFKGSFEEGSNSFFSYGDEKTTFFERICEGNITDPDVSSSFNRYKRNIKRQLNKARMIYDSLRSEIPEKISIKFQQKSKKKIKLIIQGGGYFLLILMRLLCIQRYQRRVKYSILHYQ